MRREFGHSFVLAVVTDCFSLGELDNLFQSGLYKEVEVIFSGLKWFENNNVNVPPGEGQLSGGWSRVLPHY